MNQDTTLPSMQTVMWQKKTKHKVKLIFTYELRDRLISLLRLLFFFMLTVIDKITHHKPHIWGKRGSYSTTFLISCSSIASLGINICNTWWKGNNRRILLLVIHSQCRRHGFEKSDESQSCKEESLGMIGCCLFLRPALDHGNDSSGSPNNRCRRMFYGFSERQWVGCLYRWCTNEKERPPDRKLFFQTYSFFLKNVCQIVWRITNAACGGIVAFKLTDVNDFCKQPDHQNMCVRFKCRKCQKQTKKGSAEESYGCGKNLKKQQKINYWWSGVDVMFVLPPLHGLAQEHSETLCFIKHLFFCEYEIKRASA